MLSRTRRAYGSPSFRFRPSGSRWRSHPRPELLAPERRGEVTAGGLFVGTPEPCVGRPELAAGGRRPPGAPRAGAGCPLDETEAGRLLELLQIAPRVAIGHAELGSGLPQRSALVDEAQELRPAGAEFQLFAEDHPHPDLGLHALPKTRLCQYWGDRLTNGRARRITDVQTSSAIARMSETVSLPIRSGCFALTCACTFSMTSLSVDACTSSPHSQLTALPIVPPSSLWRGLRTSVY